MATQLEGGGIKALVAGPLKKDRYFFCGFPNLKLKEKSLLYNGFNLIRSRAVTNQIFFIK